MLKHVPPLLDQYDDGGKLFIEALGGMEPPELLKTAADLSQVQPELDDYALVVPTAQGMLYRFPVTDAGNTLVSAMYFEKTGGALPVEVAAEVASNLSAALVSYGFTPPAYLATAAMAKVASVGDDDLMPTRHMTEEDIYAEFLASDPIARRYMAVAMVKEASMLPEGLAEVYAGSVLGTDFDMAIDARMPYVPDAERPVLEDLKKTATITPPDELMVYLYEYDISRNLTRLYDRHIPDAAAAVFGNTLAKYASAHDKVASVVLDGRELSSEALHTFASSRKDAIADTFGEDLAAQLVDRPVEVFSSLPAPHQRALVRMM